MGMDRHATVKVRTIDNPISGLPQHGDWAEAARRLRESISGTQGLSFTRRAFSGPKHPLQYVSQNDNPKSDAVLNRHRFPAAPHQSLVQVMSTKRWWESAPRSRLGLSPNPGFGPLQ